MSIIYIRKKFGTTMKWGMGIIAAIFLISAFYMYGGNMTTEKNDQGGYSRVAVIGGKAITAQTFQDELNRRVNAYAEQSGGQFRAVDATRIKVEVLDEMSDRTILLREAGEQKVKVSRAEVNKKFNEIKKSFPSEKAFQEGLRSSGYNVYSLKRSLREGMRIEALVARERSRAGVTDDEVKKAYQEQYGKAPSGKDFDAKAREVREALLNQKQSEALTKWMDGLRKKYGIEIMDAEIRGYKHLVGGNADKALQAFKKSLEEYAGNPYIASVYFQIGQIYDQKKLPLKAMEAYRHSLDNAKSAEANMMLGNIFRQQKKQAKALEHYKAASDLAYADFFTHFNLSSIYREMGMETEAKSEEARAREIYNTQMTQAMQAQQSRKQSESGNASAAEQKSAPQKNSGQK